MKDIRRERKNAVVNTTSEIVKNLTEADVYSILLGFLYELKYIPEYSVLSEISYLVKDSESCMNILEYFAGKTITFPTTEELAEAIQTLRLYEAYEIEGLSWKDALKSVGFDTAHGKLAKNRLDELHNMMKKYNFGNRGY